MWESFATGAAVQPSAQPRILTTAAEANGRRPLTQPANRLVQRSQSTEVWPVSPLPTSLLPLTFPVLAITRSSTRQLAPSRLDSLPVVAQGPGLLTRPLIPASRVRRQSQSGPRPMVGGTAFQNVLLLCKATPRRQPRSLLAHWQPRISWSQLALFARPTIKRVQALPTLTTAVRWEFGTPLWMQSANLVRLNVSFDCKLSKTLTAVCMTSFSVLCANLSSLSNGSIAYSETKNIPGATATANCSHGFTLNGTSTYTCLSGGAWDSAFSSRCLPLPQCNRFQNLTRRNVSYDDGSIAGLVHVGVKATFHCHDGTTLDGPNHLTCRSDGTWNHTTPTLCQPHCPSYSSSTNTSMAHRTIAHGTLTTSPHGSVEVRVNCDEGSLPAVPPTIHAYNCSGGQWTPTVDAVCEPACPAIAVNKSIGGLPAANFSGSSNLTCVSNHTLVDSASAAIAAGVFSCGSGGIWTPDPATHSCQPRMIPRPESPESCASMAQLLSECSGFAEGNVTDGSSIAFGSLTAVDVLSSATVVCASNYRPVPNTAHTYHCSSSSSWNTTVDAACELRWPTHCSLLPASMDLYFRALRKPIQSPKRNSLLFRKPY